MADQDRRIRDAYTRIPELEALVREVDRSLLEWSLALSPLERVRILNERTRSLARFERVAPEGH